MLTIEKMKAYKAAAKRQRDNWKHRAEIYRNALQEIAEGTCCGCCEPGDPQCDVGKAKDALREASSIAQDRSGWVRGVIEYIGSPK